MFSTMQEGAFGSARQDTGVISGQLGGLMTFINVMGLFLYLVVGIVCVLVYFQNLGRGIEMFILRLGMPFACIGLLNPDGGVFKGYFQKMIKIGFTVIVQLLLLRFTVALLGKYHLVMALATVLMAYKTPGILNEFMATAGNGYYGTRGAMRMTTMTSVISKGMKGGK